jgi:putative ABC transport system permease protein
MTAIWRLHLRALITDWRTALAVVGVALGGMLVVAFTVLETETGSPFDTTAALLRPASASTVLQVMPRIQARLPTSTVTRVAVIDGVSMAIPVIAELTPLWSAHGARGALMFAANGCDAGAVLRVDPCAAGPASGGAAGPGVPLSLPAGLADRLGVHPGDPLALPGGRLGDAHVARVYTAPPGATAQLVIAPSLADAQSLLGQRGTVTMAYVVAASRARADIERTVASVATVGPPQTLVPTALVTVRQTLASMRAIGIAVGALIAIVTLLLTFDARRSAVGTAMVLGASPRRMTVGFAVEGVAIGIVGGVLGLALGHLAGAWLVQQVATALLAGTGAQLRTTFHPSEIATAIGSGVAAGVIAVLWSSWQLVRQGPLANLEGHVGGLARRRSIPLWLVPAGIAMLTGSALILHAFGRGQLPFLFGQGGIFTAVVGAIAITIALAPRLGRAIAGAISRRFAVIGLSTRAESDRLPLRGAATVTTLALGLAIAVAFSSIGPLGSSTTTSRFSAFEPGGLLVASQRPWDQREGAIGNATAAAIRTTPGVAGVTVRWRAILPSSTEPRLIIGLDGPGAGRMIQPTGRFLAPVGGDRVALSTVAAGRLGAQPGERVELPTLTGPAPFEVVGVFDPVAVDDSAVGDWVLTSASTARTAFGAVRSQMDVDVARGHRASVAAALRRTGTGLVVLDAAGWASVSHGTWARWFRPFAISGYLIAAAGGLAVMNILLLTILQRRRTRAAMRAIGQSAASERATLLTQAVVLGMLAIVFGLAWSQLFVWLLSLSSPVYYGFRLVWGVVPGQVALGAAVIVALVALATIAPVLAARRLDVAAALDAE